MPQKVLAEDWTNYETRKTGQGNVYELNCTINWEADYLAHKIVKAYPLYKLKEVQMAIANCCRNLPCPYKRVSFVTCLMKILKGDC